MTIKKAGLPLSEKQVLKICIKHFFTDVQYMKTMSAILVSLIVLRRIFDYAVKNIIINIETTGNINRTILNIFMCTCVFAISTLFTDYIVLRISAVFQTNASVKAFSNILKAEAYGQVDLTSGRTQYAISEGSYAMVKMFEYCFIEIFLKITYLVSDLSLIYNNLTAIHMVVAISVAVLSTIFHLKGAYMVIDCKRRINEARGLCDKSIYENISNYEIIKSYQTEDEQISTYYGKIQPWREASTSRAMLIGLLALIHDILFALTGLIFSMVTILQGEKDLNKFRTGYNSISGLERSVENISSIYIKCKESIVSSRLILYYLNSIEGFARGSVNKRSFDKSLKFENVRYSMSGIDIFSDINFEVLKGDKVCIFGRNGSGKSTISRIIMRLCHITSGSVKMDDGDIYQYCIEDYRKLITYVPQDTNLFDDTIFNNLVYGNKRSYGEVMRACERLGIHKDILRLEQGYNTYVGERGTMINGGLRQKIFYVRAILTDAPIYIFDEPTNNLDEESSGKIVDMILGELFAKKTIIVICHDHDIVQKFPRNLHFVNGCIEEVTHN